VQENIIGHCLCVLGDSMAMPVGSMVAKFRPEFEETIARARDEVPVQPAGPAVPLAAEPGGSGGEAEQPPVDVGAVGP
jgi:NADH-quinone oxidoreductase subunit F